MFRSDRVPGASGCAWFYEVDREVDEIGDDRVCCVDLVVVNGVLIV